MQRELLILKKTHLIFIQKVVPAAEEKQLFICQVNGTQKLKTVLITLVLKKFMRLFLWNVAAHITAQQRIKKVIKQKPASRKVLKV